MSFLNYLALVVLLCCFSNPVFADNRFSCNTLGLKNADPLVENIIDRILTIGKIKQRYNVCRIAKFSNAAAMIYQQKRVIAYDPVFLEKLVRKSGERHWGKVTTLAHEIGHHIHRHTDKMEGLKKLPTMKRLAIQRQYELQADEFAGKVLANMGASLRSTQALIRILKVHVKVSNSNHPDANQRVKAVTRGWAIGCRQAGSNCNSRNAKNKQGARKQTFFSPLGQAETPHYSRFMQQAETLKGVLVNRGYCNFYATLAVRQTNRSIQHYCGFNVGSYNSPWSRVVTAQSNWCMKASAYATANEAKFRETKLATCLKKKQQNTSNKRNTTSQYRRFIKQSKHLKNIRVTRSYCNLYAALAVQQTQRNKQYRCGFERGDTVNRWSTARVAQSNWCMTIRASITAKEATYRENKLASCVP